jgi:hypothetical protein
MSAASLTLQSDCAAHEIREAGARSAAFDDATPST